VEEPDTGSPERREGRSTVVERDGRGIVTLTLNRPKVKNAIDGPMWEEMLETFREVAENDADRVLVLTGANGEFSSGADLSPQDGPPRHHLSLMHSFNRIGLTLHRLPKPALARVDGIAAGAALNLALGCDLVIASDRARFSEIFVRRGLSLDLGGSWVLPRLVGLHKAKELALLGEIISAEEAHRIGLVNRVVPADELDAAVADWAGRLAAGPPLALDMTKRMLNQGLNTTLEEALEVEAMAQSVNIASRDTREAVKAFLEKRTPVFRGR
jgi:2-(1,2-epoxy-1,2-dihydrophenyl)acetyl-CoA isomerase